MMVGPFKTVALAAVTAVLAFGASAEFVMAQQGGPIRLAPLPPPTQGTPYTNRQDARPQPGAVVVEGLDSLSEDALGILSDESGGLGNDMWAGSRRIDVMRLLRDLPESYSMRAAYILAYRVLATAAKPPVGTSDGPGMLDLRIRKLAAIGATDGALRLVNAVNARTVSDNLAAPAVRAHFRNGDFASACAVVRGFQGGYTEVFWQQALIVCQVFAGKPEQAAFGLDLLREQGMTVSPAFSAAALSASAGSAIEIGAPDSTASPDEMTFAIWLAAKAEIPVWLVETLEPGLLPALVNTPEMDPELRLAAAHRALRHGVLEGPELAGIYAKLDASAEDIAGALDAPEGVNDDRLLAYFYLAAAARIDAIGRSEALLEAWNRSREAGGFDVVALTTIALLRDVPITPDFGWLAGDATRAALAAGDNRQALDWYRLVLRQAPIVPDLARAAAALWPQVRSIGHPEPESFALTAGTGVTAAVTGQPVAAVAPRGPVPWNAARLERWIDLARSDPNSGDIGAVLMLIAALGDPVDDAQWRLVSLGDAQPVIMPDAASLAGLSRASEAGRRAETALYALFALGQSGDGPHASVVGAVAQALSKVGVNDVARALVRDAIVAEAP